MLMSNEQGSKRAAQVDFTRSGWQQFAKLNRKLGARFIRGFILRHELAAYLTAHEAAGTPLDEGCQEVRYEDGVYLEREINRDIDQLVDLKAEAREALAQMPNPDESLILELRYFSRKTWEKIAEETGYSVRHVTRLHGRGLQHFRIPDKSVLKCP